MQKKLSGSLNNRGATLITVIIAMFFLTALGTAILYMAYTSFLLSATESNSIQNFYDANEVTQQVKAGFGSMTSDAVSVAYAEKIQNFNDDTIVFEESVLNAIIAWKDPSSSLSSPIAYQNGMYSDGKPKYVYDTEIIAGFLVSAGVSADDIYIPNVNSESESDRAIHISGGLEGVSITGLANNVGNIEYDDEKIVFEAISISFENPNNRLRTNITTDIVIEFPKYFENASSDIISGFWELPDFSVISSNTTTLTGKLGTGNVYANELILPTTNTTTTLDGTVITPTKLVIPTTHTLDTSEDSQIWANGIELQNKSNLNVASDSSVYLLNDLDLRGTESTAKIEGNFYGFGNSLENPNESSAITVNGINTVLDLSAVNRLMIAGHSFIIAPSNTFGVLMGESVSVAPNQLAYLVPTTLLPEEIPSNPVITDDPITNLDDFNRDEPILEDKLLRDYGATIMPMIYNIPGSSQKIVYYFIKFSEADGANDYFADYFEHNSEHITDYLASYTSLSTVSGISQTSGHVLTQDGENYELKAVNPITINSADYMKNAYNNLVKTLISTEDGSETGANTPFEYIIDMNVVNEFIRNNPSSDNTWRFANDDGKIKAVFVNNAGSSAYLTNELMPDVNLVVATGNVEVGRDFTGLVLSNGSVTVRSNGAVNADANLVRDVMREAIYTGTQPDGTPINTRFGVLFTDDQYSAIDSEADLKDEAVIGNYVTYRNWFKS